jgi:ankyrin repeat protein/beta-lactamase regulating signal transducer with metallopeptidase domain
MMRELFLRDLSLWTCLWQSSAFAALGLIAGWLLRRRPARAYQVLLLAMMTAVAVPLLSAVVRHLDLGAFVARPTELSYALPEMPFAMSATAPETTATQPASPQSMPAAVVQPAPFRIPWQMVLRYGWLAATLALLGRLVATFLYGVHLVRHATSLAREDVQRAVDRARSKLAIPQGLQVRASGRIRSPLVWCWSRPSILLVPDPCDDSQVDWAGVVAHELAHCKRRDHITGLVAELAASLMPWNPLMWLSRRFLIRLGEQACDDWVVASGQPCEDYAESLLRFRPQRRPAFWPAVVSSKSGLAHRVRRILGDACANPRIGLRWALTLGVAAICVGIGVAFAQTRPAPAPQTSTGEVEKPVTSLHDAVALNDVEEVKRLISAGADVNAKNEDGWTPLNRGISAQGERIKQVAELLINAGADVNARGNPKLMGEARTPLHCATALISKGTDIVRLLLDRGANVNVTAERGMTPLHWAVRNENLEAVRLLVDKGADFNLKNQEGWTAFSGAALRGRTDMTDLFLRKGVDTSSFHMAAFTGNLARVKELVATGSNVNAKDEFGWTPLFWAGCAGQTTVAEFLIENKADLAAQDGRGHSLLHQAARARTDPVKLVELLIAKGADVNAKNATGDTPLHLVCYSNVAELLIAKGADINAKDRPGYTPLYSAAEANHLEVAKLLISKGADVNAEEGSIRTTPLQYAVMLGHTDMVRLLIDKGADVNIDTQTGPALGLAVVGGHTNIVELLIAKGANVNMDSRAITPLHLAITRGYTDIVELLVAKGANVNVRNSRGATPLDLAEERGSAEIIELLRKHGAKE